MKTYLVLLSAVFCLSASAAIKNLNEIFNKASAKGENIGTLFNQIRLSPDKAHVFRVTEVSPNSLFEREGIRKGDTVSFFPDNQKKPLKLIQGRHESAKAP